MPTIQDRFVMRRGLAANLASVNEVPLQGEWILVLDATDDAHRMKIGDGATRYNDLPYLAIGGGSGGGVQSIVAGTNVSVDATDPAHPIVNVNSFPSAPSASPQAGTAAALPSRPATWMQMQVGGATLFLPAYAALVNNWWRLKITANNGSTQYVTALEIEMATAPGGVNLCTLGAAFATSYVNSSNAPSGAFDGDKDPSGTGAHALNKWTSTVSPSVASPQCIGYHFATTDKVNSVRLWGCITAQTAMAPKDFVVQSSTDSTTGLDGTWTDEWAVTGQTAWAAGEVRTFNRP